MRRREGDFHCAEWGGEFSIRIHGTAAGPTTAQVRAVAKLVDNAQRFKVEATSAMVLYLHACGIVPKTVALHDNTVWDFLSPCFVEVHLPDYLASEEIAISVGFDIPWVTGHLLNIATVDGIFDDVAQE